MKISVITSAYNAEETLARTIESVLNQTFEEFEYLIVDHGSNDGTGKIIDDYKLRDNRIRKLIVEKNEGYIGKALNYGIMKSKGEYLCFLDADDKYGCNFLEHMYNTMINDCSDVAICGFIMIDENERIMSRTIKSRIILDSIESYRCFVNTQLSQTMDSAYLDYWWNKMYKKEYLIRNCIRFEKERHVADAQFNMSILFTVPKLSIVEEYGVYYTYTGVSTSGKYYSDQYTEYLDYAGYWLRFLKKYNCSKDTFKLLGERYFVFLHYNKIFGFDVEARSALIDLCLWACNNIIKQWVEICQMYVRQLKEVELTLKLIQQKYSHACGEDNCNFSHYYNMLGDDFGDQHFDWCLDYIFDEENWFSLSAQSIVESIIS